MYLVHDRDNKKICFSEFAHGFVELVICKTFNKSLRKSFDEFDVDKNDFIEGEEIVKVLVHFLGESNDSDTFYETIDINHDGKMSYAGIIL